MSKAPCDGCGRKVQIAGGIGDLWSFTREGVDGLTLKLADGTDHLLCYDCIERLPDDPAAGDVTALPDHDA